MGNLYQLHLNQFIRLLGSVVCINGPYDKYGYIIKYQEHNGTYLIRGTGNEQKGPKR